LVGVEGGGGKKNTFPSRALIFAERKKGQLLQKKKVTPDSRCRCHARLVTPLSQSGAFMNMCRGASVPVVCFVLAIVLDTVTVAAPTQAVALGPAILMSVCAAAFSVVQISLSRNMAAQLFWVFLALLSLVIAADAVGRLVLHTRII
jgi:hypothetical protein